MTTADKLPLRDALADLLGKRPTDEQFRRYWIGLEDLPFSVVHAGIAVLLKTWMSIGHPWPKHIRDAARTVTSSATTVRSEVAAALDAGEVACLLCDDTGWQVYETPEDARADRRIRVFDDRFQRWYAPVRRCGCRESNPLYRARLSREVSRP